MWTVGSTPREGGEQGGEDQFASRARKGTPVAPPPKGSVGRTLRQEIVEAAEAARTRSAAVCDAPPFGALRPC